MNPLLIPLILITVSHIGLAFVINRLQNKNFVLRRSNINIRKRLIVLEDELRFYSQELMK